jgi:hypothetical protein
MRKSDIEVKTRELQTVFWKERKQLWPFGVPPVAAMFDPAVACKVLGYEYDLQCDLGRFGNGKDRFETAGTIDRQRKIVSISTRFPYEVQRFTAAHEVGHIALHRSVVMHRDRPMFDIEPNARSQEDAEADYYAACFLAPSGLLREQFAARFGDKEPLPLTDTVAWNLCGDGAAQLLSSKPGSLTFAATVSRARSFNGRHFHSLADTFGMSAGAMAIRLRELNLIGD